MFENLLGQDEVLAQLKSDVSTRRLPPALLLAGPPGSGKMTAALEIARALSCERGAAWNCPCPSCSRHRALVHPDLLLLGSRSFPEEIPAALELLERSPGKAAAYFLVRAVRKLTRRFDGSLYAGEEARLGKALPLVRDIEEALDVVAPERAEAKALPKGAAEAAAKAAAACAKLETFVPDAPPVFMVRNVELWARLAPMGERKVAIVENADTMLESARNALLKILEEPPESVRFVLLSSRKGSMMATMLSRSRQYAFKRRDAAETALVLDRVFRSSEPAPSIESFFSSRRAFPPAMARERADAFLGAALAARSDSGALEGPLSDLAQSAIAEGHSGARALAALLEATKDFGQKDERYATSFRSFLEALASRLGDALRDERLGAAGTALVERFAALSREARNEYERYNRSPILLAESMLYAMEEEK